MGGKIFCKQYEVAKGFSANSMMGPQDFIYSGKDGVELICEEREGARNFGGKKYILQI